MVALLLFLVPSAQGRDIIDFLPEVQLARSFQLVSRNPVFEFLQIPDELFECIEAINSFEIPDQLLTDRNGDFRSAEEVRQVAGNAACRVASVLLNETSPIPVLMGDRLEVSIPYFGTTTIVDGSKEPIRFATAAVTQFSFFRQLRGSEQGGDLFMGADDKCEALREWVLKGETLELRHVAFNVLMYDQTTELNGIAVCSERRVASEAELRAEAEKGELIAAVSLSVLWVLEVNSLHSNLIESDQAGEILERGEIQSRIEEFELLILENTQRFPLVTQAVIEPLSRLYVIEADYF